MADMKHGKLMISKVLGYTSYSSMIRVYRLNLERQLSFLRAWPLKEVLEIHARLARTRDLEDRNMPSGIVQRTCQAFTGPR